jgi:hypothetical protein
LVSGAESPGEVGGERLSLSGGGLSVIGPGACGPGCGISWIGIRAPLFNNFGNDGKNLKYCSWSKGPGKNHWEQSLMSRWLSQNYEKFVERASPPVRINPHRLQTCATKELFEQIQGSSWNFFCLHCLKSSLTLGEQSLAQARKELL